MDYVYSSVHTYNTYTTKKQNARRSCLSLVIGCLVVKPGTKVLGNQQSVSERGITAPPHTLLRPIAICWFGSQQTFDYVLDS